MQSTRLLPPQFLLPSWTPCQLIQLSQRRAYHNSERGQRPAAAKPRPKPSHEKKTPIPSLFETLFPSDAYAEQRASRRLEKLPAFKWHVDLPPEGRGSGLTEFPIPIRRGTKMIEPGSLKSLRKTPVFKEARDGKKPVEKRPTVLLLSALTKSLEESDFFRLSPRGEHIEGWTSGIIKVIQGRDTHTLEPLGFYFVLFTHRLAAQKYRDNLLRMHELSKVRGFVKKSQIPLPTGHHLEEGKDIDDILRSFSLVPPSGRLSMRILQEPFTPFIHNMVEEGIHAAMNEHQGKGEATVLLATETGRFSEMDIYDAIQTDVRRRNLAWRLAGGKRDIERLNDRVVVDEEAEELYEQETRTKTLAGQARFKSRFVIAFKDRHEARRFVREWHRMPLPLTKKNWELPIVNVQMLW